jgi:hypothetical protein
LAIWNSEGEPKQTTTSTQAIGLENSEKAEAIASGRQTAKCTKDTGKATSPRAKEEWFMPKERTTSVHSLTANKTETESATSLTNRFTEEITLTIRSMGVECTLCLMAKNIKDTIKTARRMDRAY